MRTATTIGRRLVTALGVVLLLLPLLLSVQGAAAADPILQRVAGTIGEGPGTNVAQRPTGIAVHGTTMYIADGDGTNVVRAHDLATGQERIVAGTTAGPALDDVPATTTDIGEPQALATDAAGNVCIAGHHLVRTLDTHGTISTVAGSWKHQTGPAGDGGPATLGWIDPEDVAVDGEGNLYIADYFGYRIRKDLDVRRERLLGHPQRRGPATAAQVLAFDLQRHHLGATAPVAVAALGRAATISAGALHTLAAGVRP